MGLTILVKVYCKLSEVNLPNTLLQSTNRKTLRAGIDDQKGETGGRPLRLKWILHNFRHKIRWTAMSGWPERLFNIMPNRSEAELDEVNYRTICINLKMSAFWSMASAFYLPERSGEGERRTLGESNKDGLNVISNEKVYKRAALPAQI